MNKNHGEADDTEDGELAEYDNGESSEFSQNELVIDEESVDSEIMAIHQQSRSQKNLSDSDQYDAYGNDGSFAQMSTLENLKHVSDGFQLSPESPGPPGVDQEDAFNDNDSLRPPGISPLGSDEDEPEIVYNIEEQKPAIDVDAKKNSENLDDNDTIRPPGTSPLEEDFHCGTENMDVNNFEVQPGDDCDDGESMRPPGTSPEFDQDIKEPENIDSNGSKKPLGTRDNNGTYIDETMGPPGLDWDDVEEPENVCIDESMVPPGVDTGDSEPMVIPETVQDKRTQHSGVKNIVEKVSGISKAQSKQNTTGKGSNKKPPSAMSSLMAVLGSDSEDDETDYYKIDWNANLDPLPPHLFTQEAFDKFFEPCKMEAVKLTILEMHHREATKNQSNNNKKSNNIKTTEQQQQQKINNKKSTTDSDIFEDVRKEVLSVQTFDQATKYHTVIEEPKLSGISVTDRKWFSKFKERTAKGIRKTSMEEDRYKDVSLRIRQEQRDYMQHLYNCFITNPSEYFFVAPSVKYFIKSTNLNKVQSLLKGEKSFYSLKQTINMKQVPPTLSPSKFNHIGSLKTQKNIKELKLFPLNSPLPSPKEPGLNVSLNKHDVFKLCEEKNCPFYVDAQSLVAIMESLVTPTREWLVPVHIARSQRLGCNIVHFDEPLPRRNISIREANQIYYQSSLLQPTPEKSLEETISHQMFLCGKHQIIVKSSIDAIEKQSGKTYTINAKIELQPNLGFETFSITDLCNFWWRSRLSNCDQILCCRVDPRNNCLCRFDTYSRDVLCAPGCPYNPEQFFNQLNSLFDVLYNSHPGEYLLEHASGNAFFFLFERKDKGFTTLETKFKDLLNLKNELIKTNQVSASWLPVDTNIQPFSRVSDGLPCLFKPKIENTEYIALGNNKRPKKTKRNNLAGKQKKTKHSGKFSSMHLNNKNPAKKLLPPGTEDGSLSPLIKNPISYDDELF